MWRPPWRQACGPRLGPQPPEEWNTPQPSAGGALPVAPQLQSVALHAVGGRHRLGGVGHQVAAIPREAQQHHTCGQGGCPDASVSLEAD